MQKFDLCYTPHLNFFFEAFPAFRSKLFCGPPFFALPHPPRAQKGVSCGHSFWAEKRRPAAKGFPLQSGLKQPKAKSQKPKAF